MAHAVDEASIQQELTKTRQNPKLVVTFWSEPRHRASTTYQDHRDINDVMLATAIAPEGCLQLPD